MAAYIRDQCPMRGPALSHTRNDATRPDGSCIHCFEPLTETRPKLPLSLEDLMTMRSTQPNYDGMLRLHGTSSMMAYRAHRPILANEHASAARLMMRAFRAERDDPAPDFLPG